MTDEKENKLQVIITCGTENIARAVFGFAFAASAAVSGINVNIILALNAVVLSLDDEPLVQDRINGFNSIREYMTVLSEQGCNIYLCSTCVKSCGITKLSNNNISSRFSLMGLTEMAISVSKDSIRTVVF